MQAKQVRKMRLQLDLSPYEAKQLDRLTRMSGVASRKDLFNSALTLLGWATREVALGKKVASFDDNRKERTILSMPALNHASAVGRRYL